MLLKCFQDQTFKRIPQIYKVIDSFSFIEAECSLYWDVMKLILADYSKLDTDLIFRLF